MQTTTNVIFNWSGGKDSSFALWRLQQQAQYQVVSLLTTLSEDYKRIAMHGVRDTLLDRQTEAIGLPLKKLYMPAMPDMSAYESAMRQALAQFADQGVKHAVFGDIFLQDLRAYREQRLAEVGFEALFPLWEIPTQQLIYDFIEAGFKAVTVCVNGNVLDKSFVGRLIDRDFVADLPAGVDPCGENGEYHSFVFDGPIFKQPVSFALGEVVARTYPSPVPGQPESVFWFCDLTDAS